MNKYKIILAFIVVLYTQSCNKTFDKLAINPAQPSMTTFFSDPIGVNSAVMAMYGYISTQRCMGASGSKIEIIRSDEASSNSDYGQAGMYGANMNASYYTIEQPYMLMYTTASQASYIIDNIGKIDFKENNDLKKAYLGEAYFFRAFAHFLLLINYRNIAPITTSPQTSADYVRTQWKPEDVWNLIQEDLKKAEENLPNKLYWTGNSIGRVSKGSAAGLLGEVYLYRSGIEKYYGDNKTTFYNEAAIEFNKIITGQFGEYNLVSDYSWNFDVDHENNSESVFEIQFLGDVINNSFNPSTATSGLAFDGRSLMMPGTGSGYEGVVHEWLYNAFVNSIDNNGNTDIRMFSTLLFNDSTDISGIKQTQRLTSAGGKVWSYLYPASKSSVNFPSTTARCQNYKAGIKKGLDQALPVLTNADGTANLAGVGAGVQQYVYNQPRAHGINWRYIRYADILLMYAEAILNGGTQGSITPTDAVNQVRRRAQLADLGNATIEDIKNERVLELALEGHRYFDLLRWGMLVNGQRFKDLQNVDPNFKKLISATDYQGFNVNRDEWLPIPISEIQANPLTKQNPGY